MIELSVERLITFTLPIAGIIIWFVRLEAKVRANETSIKNLHDERIATTESFKELKDSMDKLLLHVTQIQTYLDVCDITPKKRAK